MLLTTKEGKEKVLPIPKKETTVLSGANRPLRTPLLRHCSVLLENMLLIATFYHHERQASSLSQWQGEPSIPDNALLYLPVRIFTLSTLARNKQLKFPALYLWHPRHTGRSVYLLFIVVSYMYLFLTATRLLYICVIILSYFSRHLFLKFLPLSNVCHVCLSACLSPLTDDKSSWRVLCQQCQSFTTI